MCGRFVQVGGLFADTTPWPEIADDLQVVPDRYNLAPTQRAAIIMDADGRKVVKRLRWGLIAPWMRDLKAGFTTINARVETVATKPAYRAAFKAPRRCLIPMAGYYEWVPTGKIKQPYYIARADGGTLYAAGLWEPRHHLQDDDAEGSCTVITQDAVDNAGIVHDRMPVFLSPDVADAWMTSGPEEAMAILHSAEVPHLSITRVSRAINNSRNPGGPESLLPSDE